MAKKKKRSHLEQKFAAAFAEKAADYPQPIRQLRFAWESMRRSWRFDFAWPEHRVAVEIDGGIFIGGGHNRGMAFTADCHKLNAATMLDWRLFRYTTKDLEKESRVDEIVSEVKAALDKFFPGYTPKRQKSMIPDEHLF